MMNAVIVPRCPLWPGDLLAAADETYAFGWSWSTLVDVLVVPAATLVVEALHAVAATLDPSALWPSVL